MGQILPFDRFGDRFVTGAWTRQEVLDLERELARAGGRWANLVRETGVTSEGDAWLCLLEPRTGAALLHVARLSGRYLVHLSTEDRYLESSDLVTLLRRAHSGTPAAALPSWIAGLAFATSIPLVDGLAGEMAEAVCDAIDATTGPSRLASSLTLAPASRPDSTWDDVDLANSVGQPVVAAACGAAKQPPLMHQAVNSSEERLDIGMPGHAVSSLIPEICALLVENCGGESAQELVHNPTAFAAAPLDPNPPSCAADPKANELGPPRATVLLPEALPWLRGGEADDHLVAPAGGAAMSGDGGDDTLEGSTGSDTLEGGAGADLLIFGPGDLAQGEAGSDIFAYRLPEERAAAPAQIADFVIGEDVLCYALPLARESTPVFAADALGRLAIDINADGDVDLVVRMLSRASADGVATFEVDPARVRIVSDDADPDEVVQLLQWIARTSEHDGLPLHWTDALSAPKLGSEAFYVVRLTVLLETEAATSSPADAVPLPRDGDWLL